MSTEAIKPLTRDELAIVLRRLAATVAAIEQDYLDTCRQVELRDARIEQLEGKYAEACSVGVSRLGRAKAEIEAMPQHWMSAPTIPNGAYICRERVLEILAPDPAGPVG